MVANRLEGGKRGDGDVGVHRREEHAGDRDLHRVRHRSRRYLRERPFDEPGENEKDRAGAEHA